MSKKKLVLDAFDNKKVERVPVGFWFHFVNENEFYEGLNNDNVIIKNINGHKKFYKDFKPDFLKLMSDGFFAYPNENLINAKSVSEVKSIKPIGGNHPWIKAQVNLVKELVQTFGDEVVSFYNIFAPATFLKILLSHGNNGLSLKDFINEDPDLLKDILDVISDDIKILARKVIVDGGADGIYLSVQNVQEVLLTKEDYLNLIAPSELKVLNATNEVSDYNILHICGYEGAKNDLSIYKDYDAKVYNWAVNVEGITIEDGRKLFPNKAIIGGFANTKSDVLYKGQKEEVESFATALVSETTHRGLIVGADCTVPNDIEIDRLKWVRDKVRDLTYKI